MTAAHERTFDELLDEVADRDEPWLVLTDEELGVVTAGVAAEDRLVGLDVLDALPQDAQQVALRTASRSLQARGLIAPAEDAPTDVPPDRDDGLIELEVRAPLIVLLDLLSTPWPTALASSQRDGRRTRRVLQTIGTRAVLEHEARDGVHRFSLFTPERAVVELAAFLDPDGVAATGQDREVLREPLTATPPERWTQLRARMDAAASQAQLLLLGGEAPEDRILFELAPVDDRLLLTGGESPGEDGLAREVVVREVSATMLLGIAAHALRVDTRS